MNRHFVGWAVAIAAATSLGPLAVAQPAAPDIVWQFETGG
jgi:hypothetical protein